MNIKDYIKHIRNTFTPQEKLEDEVVLKFLNVLENLEHEGVTCSELYEQLDEFVDREVKSHDAAKIMPLIQEHLDMCPECCDEYEALLNVLDHNDKETTA
jgi:hypothetical protein